MITENQQNSARLASFLMEPGAKILIEYFIDQIKKKFDSLEAAYESIDFQKALEHHKTGYNGAVQLFTTEQYDAIQLSGFKKGNLQNMNFSLILNLLEAMLVQNRSKLSTYTKRELPELHEKIKLLKHARVTIFLELHGKGTNNARFCSMMKALTDTFQFFAPMPSVKRALTRAAKCIEKRQFTVNALSKLRNDMMLCQNDDDLNTHDFLRKYNTILLSLQETHGRELALVQDSVNNLSDLLDSFLSFMPSVQCQLIAKVDVLSAQVMSRFDDMEAQIQSGLDNTKTGLDDVREEMKQTKQDLGAKVDTGTKQVMSELRGLRTALDVDARADPNVQEVKQVFDEHADSFKILVLNRPQNVRDTKSELSGMLGQCKWDFIIDIDQESMVSGLHDSMVATLVRHKTYFVFIFGKDKVIPEHVCKQVVDGEQTIWFQADEEFVGKALKALDSLLNNILRSTEYPKSILTVATVLGGAGLQFMKKVVGRLEDVFDEVGGEHVNAKGLSLVVSSLNTSSKLENLETNMKKVDCAFFISQAKHAFSSLFSADFDQETYYFPGDKGKCSLSYPEFNQLRTMMVLYHQDVGKVTIEGDQASKLKELTERRIQYLKGGNISPEEFFLHQEYGKQFYVVREDMESARLKIEEHLKARLSDQWTQSPRFEFKLLHDPSGGGSTVLGYILYSLRDQYPCVLLRHIDDDTLPSALATLYRKANKPLLVAIDNPEIAANDIQCLNYLLSAPENLVKCLIVYTEVVTPSPSAKCSVSSVSSVDDYFSLDEHRADTKLEESYKSYVRSELNERDLEKFHFLYEEFENLTHMKTNKVYLFGLNAFRKDYKRLNEVVMMYLEQATTEQLKLVRIVCCLDKYADFNPKLRLLSFLIVGESKFTGTDQELFNRIGAINDLLIYNAPDNTVRAVHKCIVDPVYRYLRVKKDLSMQDILELHVRDLIEIITNDSSEKKMSGQLCFNLVLQRSNQITENFSPFVRALIDEFKIQRELVSEYLKSIVTALGKSSHGYHCRSMYARFLFHNMQNINESVKEMRLAVGISDADMSIQIARKLSQNHTLLHAYGTLFRHIANEIFKQLKDGENKNEALDSMLRHVKESVFAFKLAQTSLKRSEFHRHRISPMPFIEEARVRIGYLSRLFEYRSINDNEKFQRDLAESTDTFVKECADKALAVLDEISYYIKACRVDDQHPLETDQRIVRHKFQLLKMRHDPKVSMRKTLQDLDENIPCDIGLFARIGNLPIRFNTMYQAAPTCNRWHDLYIEDLELVIETIGKRIGKHKLLAANYYDIIKAMITLREHNDARKKHGKYNLDYAIQCAAEWITHYPDNLHAHFMHSVLHLAKGLQKKTEHNIYEFSRSFKKCQDMLKKNPAAYGRTMRRYQLGNGYGLAAILHYKKDTGRGRLRTFYGRLISKGEIIMDQFSSKLKVVPDTRDNPIRLQIAQKPNVKFNLVIGYLSLTAINIERNESED